MMEKIFVVTVLIVIAVDAAFDWTKPNVLENERPKNMEDLVTEILKQKGLTGDLLEEVSVLKEKIKQQEHKIMDLTIHVTSLNKVVEKQDIVIKRNVKENEELKSFVLEQENQISHLDKHIERLKEEIPVSKQHLLTKQAKYVKTGYGSSEVKEKQINEEEMLFNNSSAVTKRHGSKLLKDKVVVSAFDSKFGPVKQARRAVADEVAFSAYLSKPTHYVSGHTVKFDQVLTNYGNGYNKYTGVFSVPTTGVYLLTFSIAINHPYSHIKVKLLDNNRSIVDASADPGSATKTDMGGNTVIVDLTAGQSAWLEVYDCMNVNGQMYSSNSNRYATFSGAKLF